MTKPIEKLAKSRKRIDDIDLQLQDLLNERAACAQQVAVIKQQIQGEEHAIYYCPEREAQVLTRVMQRNKGPLKDEEIARLFREIMSACLALEYPMKIAFLGPEGTFTQAAALTHFGHSIESVPLTTIDEVFHEVESGSAYYGIVPVENSTEGVVNLTLDAFMRSSLNICGEVALRIHHHFLVKEGQPIEEIKQIYSHQQSFAQCSQWLAAHCHQAEWITVESNAAAAKYVAAKQEKNVAAVASDVAADLYGLTKFAENIENQSDNTTRFLIIGRQTVKPSGNDKTSIIVSMSNQSGALFHLLEPFNEHNISLTRIETRPSANSTWAYVFFIDFEGHYQDEVVARVLTKVAEQAIDLKILGSYPNAVL